jgi:hypothetical protein
VLAFERPSIGRLAAVLIAIAVGAAVVVAPLPVVAGTIAAVAAIWVLSLGARVKGAFLGALAVILFGYAFFNRAFAYAGVPPLFVGELVLMLGVLAFLYSLERWRLNPTTVAILVFMGWGLAQTIPYVPRYGVDAIRDGVAWLYASFALIIATVMLPEQMAAAVRLVRRVLPYFLVWVPVAGLSAIALQGRLPTVPGTNVPLLAFKGGDAGVLLAGAAAFILVGLYARAEPKPRLPEPLPWIPWLAGAGVVAIINRGGFVAITMTAFALAFVRRSGRVAAPLFIIAVLVVLGTILNPTLDVGGDRQFSFSQLTDNLTSIFVSTDNSLEGTRSFRLRWWGEIVDYTVNGPYFWAGKGYGVALAVSDGFNITSAEILRSPHNAHIEMLARSGVPGLIVWVALQVTFGVSMVSAALKANREGRLFWVQVIGWLFVMWLAALANMTFDPYLQGPQGGIWFWSVMGLGMVAMRGVQTGLPDPWPAPGGEAGPAEADGARG